MVNSDLVDCENWEQGEGRSLHFSWKVINLDLAILGKLGRLSTPDQEM